MEDAAKAVQLTRLASCDCYCKVEYEVDEGVCKSRVPQAPKRQAVGSPETGDLNTHDPNYAPIVLSKSEADDEMRDP